MIALISVAALVGCSCEDEDIPTSPHTQSSQTQSSNGGDEIKDYPSAHNFKFKDINGNELRLTDLAKKPIVLNFWSTTCPPCIAEMPTFELLHRKYGDKVNFVMLNIDKDINDAIEFFGSTNQPYSLPVYHDFLGTGTQFYNITTIPKTFFISRNGKIISSLDSKVTSRTLEDGILNLIKNALK